MFEAIPVPKIKLPEANMDITYYGEFTVRECSVGKLPFHGTVTIRYCPEQRMLEFESFDRWLKENIAPRSATIEDIANIIFNALVEEIQPKYIHLTVDADTMVHYPARVELSL